MKVIHFPQFSAPYKGSFIRSLERLEIKGNDKYKFIYCFPRKTESTSWINEFSQNHQVYFTDDNVKKSTSEILEIFRKVKPDIVHTHFDGYDIPVTRARDRFFKETGKYIKVVWHLRNQIRYEENYLKKFYQYMIFKNHYGKWSKKVNIISVNEGMKCFVNEFSDRSKLNVQTEVIPNGIDVDYFISLKKNTEKNIDVFGAYGSYNSQKRIDLLLKAAIILNNKKLKFHIIIVNGIDTNDIISNLFKGEIPKWLTVMDRTRNVEEFYNKITCFVSTSVHETFSNAIAEATMFELPVIQSDIQGTMWNAENPSTFLFKSLDVEDLANVMEKVLSFPKEEMKKHCSITRQNNIDKYGVDLWAERVLKFYSKSQ